MKQMTEITIGKDLSFNLTFKPSSTIKNVCFYSIKKDRYYIHAPKIELLEKILKENNVDLHLTDDAIHSYDELKKVTVKTVSNDDDGSFYFMLTFPKYPSNPLFIRNLDYWRWANLSRKISKKGERAVYKIEYPYMLIEAMKWLEREGFIIFTTAETEGWLARPSDNLGTIKSMELDPDLELRQDQQDDIENMKNMDYRGVFGSSPGLGKTIEAGKVIYDLWKAKKVSRGIWISPTSSLAYQVRDELKGKFGLDAVTITREHFDKNVRLGTEQDDVTLYEKHGFVIVTWATFVRDWTGKTFKEHTRNIWFDIMIMDEAQRVKSIKNKSFEAALNCVAPYRIILTGTILPNGDWRELLNMINAIEPSRCLLQWYLNDKEDKMAEEFSHDPEIENPRQDAKIKMTSRVLALLLNKVTRHTKEEVASFLPELVEGSVHVTPNAQEDKVIEKMIDLLSKIIEKWQSSLFLNSSKRKEDRTKYKIIENAKNMIWGDLNRFCGHGSFRLKERMESIMKTKTNVNDWIRDHYNKEIREIHEIISKKEIRKQPKNEKVHYILKKIVPERCLIFYNSIDGAINLSTELKKNGDDVKVIFGEKKSMDKKDAELLEQPRKITDNEIDNVMEWYWFPWITISRLSNIENVKTTFIPRNGKKKNAIYYVDAHNLGNEFSIEMTWNDELHEETRYGVNDIIMRLEGTWLEIKRDDMKTLLEKNGKFTMHITLNKEHDRRILVTTDKLKEGINLQNTDLVIFYDQPMSILMREQRIGRVIRMHSAKKKVTLISISLGLDHAIKKNLKFKYEAASRVGHPDPSPVSMKNILKTLKEDKTGEKETNIFDFI